MHWSFSWEHEAHTLSIYENIRCSIYAFAKLRDILVSVTATEKVYFIEHTQICWYTDLFFNINFRNRSKNTVLPFRAVPLKQGNLSKC